MSTVVLPSNVTTNKLINVTNQSTSAPVLSLPSSSSNESEKKFILITSFMLSNKSLGSVTTYARINSSTTNAFLLYGVDIPAGTAFEVIQGNKFILKEGDSLQLWCDGAADTLDAIISYVEHRPNTIYNS